MALQGDLIDEAMKAGKLTVCPPARAAGHKHAKKKKGQRIRPCVRCQRPVKFIKGAWEAHKQRRKGWHWVNENGGHHRCSDFRRPGALTHRRP